MMRVHTMSAILRPHPTRVIFIFFRYIKIFKSRGGEDGYCTESEISWFGVCIPFDSLLRHRMYWYVIVPALVLQDFYRTAKRETNLSHIKICWCSSGINFVVFFWKFQTDVTISLQWRHMTTMASQIISLAVVYSIVYSGSDQRKHPRTKGQ